MKRFVTVADVEDLVRGGASELVVDGNTVLTAAARDKAADLRLHVREGDAAPARQAPPIPSPTAPAAPRTVTPSVLGAPAPELVAEITRRVMQRLQSQPGGSH